MMIITISREFGSGGRELGKRLADALGIPCYDYEIIELISQEKGLHKDYVSRLSEKRINALYGATIAKRFVTPHPTVNHALDIHIAQQKILKELASKGSCVIVGRGADVILQDRNPFKLFVYADEESKLARCKSRAAENEKLSDKEILRKMKEIDRNRAGYHDLLTDTEWGDRKDYHLCINTSGKEIRALVPALTKYIKCWFGESEN